jgi:hypothetical protein
MLFFRLERVAGWGFHPLENAALSRRTPEADLPECFLISYLDPPNIVKNNLIPSSEVES